jgi:multicomponent Na+:H+ antiporter subunit E
MNYLVLNIGLALAWTALTGQYNPANLVIGAILGYGALFVSRRAIGPSSYFVKVRQVFTFVGFFFWELVSANLRVAFDVLTPGFAMRPRIVAVPLDARTDAEITALSYLISLTPGSLSLDVSSDRRVLFVHAMYAQDADACRREIKEGLERRLLAVMRGVSPQEEAL